MRFVEMVLIALGLLGLAYVLALFIMPERADGAQQAQARMLERCDRMALLYDIDLKKCYRQAVGAQEVKP